MLQTFPMKLIRFVQVHIILQLLLQLHRICLFILNKCTDFITSILKNTNFSKINTCLNPNRYLVNILTYIMLIFILINILLFIYDIYSHSYAIELLCNIIPDGVNNDKIPMDPVRWWPSGVPQGWTVVGTGLATYGFLSKIPGISPRARVLSALASAGVSATHLTYHSALENSVGFNRFMWGLTEYRKTGTWPSIDQVAKTTTDKQLSDFASEAVKHADNSTVQSIVNEVSANKFIPSSNWDYSDFINQLSDLIFKQAIQLLKPAHVHGFLDDLIGQRMFIEIILFIMCICIILLIIISIFNLIFLFNKDKIIKKFDNKFITFYIKYQTFLSRVTLFYLPIFIFTGLFTLCHGLYWLVTNQIPYESLDIDLHQFISSKSVLGLALSSNIINWSNKTNKNNTPL